MYELFERERQVQQTRYLTATSLFLCFSQVFKRKGKETVKSSESTKFPHGRRLNYDRRYNTTAYVKISINCFLFTICSS